MKISIDSNIEILSSRDRGRKLVPKGKFFNETVYDLVENYPKRMLTERQQKEYDCLEVLLKNKNIVFYRSGYLNFEINFRQPDSIRSTLFKKYEIEFKHLVCPFMCTIIIAGDPMKKPGDPMEKFCSFLKRSTHIDPIIEELNLVKNDLKKDSTFFDCYLLLEAQYNNIDYFLTDDGKLKRKTVKSDKFENKVLYPSELLKVMEDK